MDANQQAILKTSGNALQAKAAAVTAGYYDDAYMSPFVGGGGTTTTRIRQACDK
jgi:hypothetical protein